VGERNLRSIQRTVADPGLRAEPLPEATAVQASAVSRPARWPIEVASRTYPAQVLRRFSAVLSAMPGSARACDAHALLRYGVFAPRARLKLSRNFGVCSSPGSFIGSRILSFSFRRFPFHHGYARSPGFHLARAGLSGKRGERST
jgi:hypothetical protein